MSLGDSCGEFTAKGWGLNEDNKFIEYLMEQRSAGPFVFDSIKVKAVLQNVKKRLSTYLSRPVLIDLVREKFMGLRREYNLFNNILATKGVIYDVDINFVYIPVDQRCKLIEMYPGAKKYFHEAPYKWDEKKVIFSANDVASNTLFAAHNTHANQ